ncbi:MAG: glutamate-1-semialdehyde 2,1-aminomutase [Candidatus Omnitrophota bacterium]
MDKRIKLAKQYLVGGVNSPVRAFKLVGAAPIWFKEGKGSRLYDYNGKEYIDFVLGWGAMILGHSHPEVLKNLKRALNSGWGFGATHQSEIELAKIIREAIPFIEKIRFVNSGTEAVMGAIRLSRGYTGRDKILKFEHSYHGHADYLLAKAGSGLATLGIPLSAGVPKEIIQHTLIVPFGNAEKLKKIFQKYGSQIAAVIVEPVGGNYGVIEPNIDFLKKLDKITRQFGAVLIFDEIITGFRFRFGSAAQGFDVKPDLICLGKIIGGGLPIGAFGGREEIMRALAPEGKVYQASTFAGNPLVMQAGISTLNILKAKSSEYRKLNELTQYLAQNIPLEINHYGSMFSFKFKEKNQFPKFYRAMLRVGIYLAPSPYEANFLCFAHTREDIEHLKISIVSQQRLMDNS